MIMEVIVRLNLYIFRKFSNPFIFLFNMLVHRLYLVTLIRSTREIEH